MSCSPHLLRQGTERISVSSHEIAALVDLLLHFRVVGSKQVAFWSLHRKECVVLLDFHSNQHFLGQQNPGGSSDRSQFEFHVLPPFAHCYVYYNTIGRCHSGGRYLSQDGIDTADSKENRSHRV